MEYLRKHVIGESDPAAGVSRSGRILALVQPGLILGTAFVIASVVFLTDAEVRLLFGTESALYKLVAGGILLALLGIFFVQQAERRRRRTNTEAEFLTGSADLAAMTRTLEQRTEERSRSGKDPSSSG